MTLAINVKVPLGATSATKVVELAPSVIATEAAFEVSL